MLSRRHTPRIALLLAFLASACGRNSGKQSPGAWSARQAWRVVEEARIGATDGEGPDALGSVVDAALDPLGRVWVADGQRRQVLVFDTRGKHVRTIGAPGAGPREFGAISGMDFAPDGKLWVLDSGNARFAVYDTTGALVITRPRNSPVVIAPWPGGFDRAGRMYDVGMRINPDGRPAMLVLRSEGGNPPTSLALPEFKGDYFEAKGGNPKNPTITRLGVPYTGGQAWAFDPDGHVWVANTARYHIESHNFDGGAAEVVERDVDPVPVTREDRARILEENDFFIKQGGKIDMARIPDHQPALNGFLFDDAGRMWVMPALGAEKSSELDVFAPGGAYLGRVPLPGRAMTVRTIRGDRMVALARDSLDVESVILLRIVKPAG